MEAGRIVVMTTCGAASDDKVGLICQRLFSVSTSKEYVRETYLKV